MKFIILAGGIGSRLWPLSSKQKPKQFQNFIGDKTLLQLAYNRLSFTDKSNIFVATNTEYVDLVKEQLPQLENHQLIVEPTLRDTGPSMAFAVKYLESLFGPEETVSIIYADQFIKDKDEFEKKLTYAHKLASDNDKFVIIEVKAKYPNPNLGYVKIGKLIKQEDDIEVHELDHFTEKPDYQTAKKFVESFKYLWNTGFYVWKTGFFLNQLQEHAPEISEILNQITDFSDCQDFYEKFPKISLDYALMEKIDPTSTYIIPAELGWSDIGTWKTLHEEFTENTEDNLIQGKVETLDTKGSVIINKEDKKIVVLNLKDVVVVNTEKEILICPKSEDKLIKEAVQKFNLL